MCKPRPDITSVLLESTKHKAISFLHRHIDIILGITTSTCLAGLIIIVIGTVVKVITSP